MKRFNEEIIYVKSCYISISCLTKVKVVIGERQGICADCIYLQINTSCPNNKYGACCEDNQIFKLYK